MRYHLPTFEKQCWHITCRHLERNYDIRLADVWRAVMRYHLQTFEEQRWVSTYRHFKRNYEISLADVWREMKRSLANIEEHCWDISCWSFKRNYDISLADIWRAMAKCHLPTLEEEWWGLTRSTAHCGLCVTYSTRKLMCLLYQQRALGAAVDCQKILLLVPGQPSVSPSAEKVPVKEKPTNLL